MPTLWTWPRTHSLFTGLAFVENDRDRLALFCPLSKNPYLTVRTTEADMPIMTCKAAKDLLHFCFCHPILNLCEGRSSDISPCIKEKLPNQSIHRDEG